MNHKLAFFSAFIFVVPASMLSSQALEGHKVVQPQDVTWGQAPAALPAGAQVAVLFGDPSKQGLFAMRLKAPKGYSIPPHSHPNDEVVTVISGKMDLGMGKTADPAKAMALPAGTFFALAPGMAHFAHFGEETVLQINTIGPWGINYINPKDDPRQKTQ